MELEAKFKELKRIGGYKTFNDVNNIQETEKENGKRFFFHAKLKIVYFMTTAERPI